MTAAFPSPAEMAAAIRDGTYAPAARAQTAVARAAPVAWPAHVDGQTHQKVRRDSQPYEAGDAFYLRRGKKFLLRVKHLAVRLLIKSMEQRRKGRWGPFSPIDLQLLNDMMYRWMD